MYRIIKMRQSRAFVLRVSHCELAKIICKLIYRWHYTKAVFPDIFFILVEIIGSWCNIGSGLGYPAGLIYERIGRFCSFAFALVLTGSSMMLLFATQYTATFYSTNWGLMGLYLFLYGRDYSFREMTHFIKCYPSCNRTETDTRLAKSIPISTLSVLYMGINCFIHNTARFR